MVARGVLGGELLGDPFGVTGVVGRDVQDPASDEPVGHQFQRPGLHEAAFVMPRLGPRVGEEQPDTGQAGRTDQLGEHHRGIPADHPDIRQTVAIDESDELREARPVDLHREDIHVGFGRGHRGGRDAGSAADLEDRRRLPAEERLEVERAVGLGVGGQDVHAELRPQGFPVALLAGRQAAPPEPETGHARVLAGAFGAVVHVPIVPHRGGLWRSGRRTAGQRLGCQHGSGRPGRG